MKGCTGIAALLLLASGTTAAAAHWQFEPTNFMGVPLNGNVLEQVLECTEVKPQVLCHQKAGTDGEYALLGLPYIGIPGTQSAAFSLKEGVLQSMRVGGDIDNFNVVIQAVTTRYGLPTGRERQQLEISPGVMHHSEVMTWTGKSMMMQLHRDADNLGTYTWSISMIQPASELDAKAESSH